ncbi:hypothetical protein DFH09DRAFT_1198848 [Mycena vulgaris]|nr:hypothetical protein DFH09DRAFT_1198848 [Mycena vulgaris]
MKLLLRSLSAKTTASRRSDVPIDPNLPADLFLEIASHLMPADLLSFSLTSSHLRHLLLPELYKSVSLFSGACLAALEMLSMRPDLRVHVVTLSVDLLRPSPVPWPKQDVGEERTTMLIEQVLPALTNLQTFNWAGKQIPPDRLFLRLRNACPKLKNISCVAKSIHFNPDCELFKFTGLTGFTFWVSYQETKDPPPFQDIPPQLCDMLLQRCPKLETLSLKLLSMPNLERWEELDRLTTGTWPSLRSFHLDIYLLDGPLSWQPPTQNLGTFLSAHPGITDLTLHPFVRPGMAPCELPLLLNPGALPRLTSFEGAYQHLSELPNPQGLATLVLYNYTSTTYISRASIITALQQLTGLKTLAMGFGETDEHSAIEDIVSACPNLTALHIQFHTDSKFGTKRLRQISRELQALPHLRKFSLAKNYHLSDETMLSSALIFLQDSSLLHEIRVMNFMGKFWLQEGKYRRSIDAEGRKSLDVREFGLRRAYPPETFNRTFRYSLQGGDHLLGTLSKGLARIRR